MPLHGARDEHEATTGGATHARSRVTSLCDVTLACAVLTLAAMRSWLPILPALISVTSCGGATSVPPHPAITIDAPSCERALETIATIESATPNQVEVFGLAVGADGTAYFSRWGGPPGEAGIYAVARGAAPRWISPLLDVARLFVDGDTLVVGGLGSTVYSVPTRGGDPTVLSQAPVPQGEHERPLSHAWALDATWAYAFTTGYGPMPNKLWRFPRAGGAPELLFESADKQYQASWNSSLMLDGDALDFVSYDSDGATVAATGGLMQIPKTGGTPFLLRPDVRPLGSPDWTVRVGDTFYGTGYRQALTAFARDGSAPRAIDGVDGWAAAVQRTIGDAQSAYAAILTGPPDALRTAFARLPSGDEHTAATACTAGGSDDSAFEPTDMALDASHVYALGWSRVANRRWTIVRAPR